jgi:predicted transcriptional regulator
MPMSGETAFDTMVQRVSWMSPIDYFILEFYEDHDIEASPKVVAENINYDRQYTGKRLKTLASEGLLVQKENGLYCLTDRGRGFIAGDLDAEDLENADE